jgi:hypothetical protein
MGVQIKNGLLNHLRSFIIKHLMLNFLRELTTGIVFTYVSRSLKSELCLNNVSLIYRRTVQPYLLDLFRANYNCECEMLMNIKLKFIKFFLLI